MEWALADWDDARRGESYRIVAVDVATGAEIVSRLVEESEAMLEGVPLGKAIRLSVTARNAAGGESAPSAAVTITLS